MTEDHPKVAAMLQRRADDIARERLCFPVRFWNRPQNESFPEGSDSYVVDYAAEGRAKAEAFGPRMTIVPQSVDEALFWAVYDAIASRFDDAEVRKAILGNSTNNDTIRLVREGLEKRGFEIVKKEPSNG